ncbi:hypothetical protein BU17DRAFT_86986 [Hysterangium stoloniferum]|nr:hypothetical protein BU17DRAFT_86986 [Hysterangium stoloniferum]
MPRKTRADCAPAENLHKFTKKASVDAVPDEETIPAALPHPESHNTSNMWSCHNGEVDPKLHDISGVLRDTAMVDDEDESSESGSEDEEEGEVPEIQEISALEWFSSTLQKAHDLALAAERE